MKTDIKELMQELKAAACNSISESGSKWFDEAMLGQDGGISMSDEDAKFIALTSPENITALIEALEAKDAECKHLSDELRGATALLTLMKIDARELVKEAEAKDVRIADLQMLLEGSDAIIADYAETLGCAGDTDSILAAIVALQSRAEAADKLQDSTYRDGLKAGFSYGQTNDQAGFERSLNAYSGHNKREVK